MIKSFEEVPHGLRVNGIVKGTFGIGELFLFFKIEKGTNMFDNKKLCLI